MEKTCSAEINGRNYFFEESAYNMLNAYLRQYSSHLPAAEREDGMRAVEVTLDQLLQAKLNGRDTVSLQMVSEAVEKIGLPGGFSFNTQDQFFGSQKSGFASKRLFRDPSRSMIGGVCSGLALFFGVEVTILRVVFLLAMILGLSGFWIYVICWIVMPVPRNPADLCAQYGLAPTQENMDRFSSGARP